MAETTIKNIPAAGADTAAESADVAAENAKLAEENARLRRQLEEANAANAAKETFLSNMSHDIRTPLNAIIGLSALAKRHIDEKARILDSISKIEIASDHLLSLVNDVLDMSRINSGRMQLQSESFSLSDLLHDCMTILRPQLEKKNHTYKLETENIERESLRGDALRLRQIYVNIVNNAVKFTNDGGDIRISVSQELTKGKCLLTFVCTDNGIGMSEEFLKRIFVPFERVNSSTISGIEGTGLGMSIVKKMVDAMGGTIAIKSAPGCGTTVTVSIPLEYEKIEIDTSALSRSRLLILVSDTKEEVLYRRYLDEFGISYTVASSMQEIMAALTDADFHGEHYDGLVIGSSRDEGMSVLDLAQYISKSYPSVVQVLISDLVWEDIEYQAVRSGIRTFIPLPFFRKSLINGLNRALSADSPAAGVSAGPDLTGRRILLVEDNMINMEIAKEILSTTGAEIECAVNGREGVERFTGSPERHFDLILMDVQMPVMDGYEATRAIRGSGREDGSSVPIYAMTANTFAEDIARSREAGMNGHLAKPIDINALMQMLRGIAR